MACNVNILYLFDSLLGCDSFGTATVGHAYGETLWTVIPFIFMQF